MALSRGHHMEHLDRSRCALVIVDVQNDFCHEDGAFGRAGHDLSAAQAVLSPICALRDAAHDAEVPVIVVKVAHSKWTDDAAWRSRFDGLPPDRRPRGPVAEVGTWGAQLFELEEDPRDLVITKHRYSAFAYTPLALVLRAAEVSTLVITGVQTDVCVLSTARDALDAGVLPVVVEDAVATTGQTAHDAALEAIRVRLGPVVSSGAVRASWTRVRPSSTNDRRPS